MPEVYTRNRMSFRQLGSPCIVRFVDTTDSVERLGGGTAYPAKHITEFRSPRFKQRQEFVAAAAALKSANPVEIAEAARNIISFRGDSGKRGIWNHEPRRRS